MILSPLTATIVGLPWTKNSKFLSISNPVIHFASITTPLKSVLAMMVMFSPEKCLSEQNRILSLSQLSDNCFVEQLPRPVFLIVSCLKVVSVLLEKVTLKPPLNIN